MKYIARGTIKQETEKAYGLDIDHPRGQLLWVPKSVVEGQDERGLVVAKWWAERNGTAGGAIAKYKETR